MTRMKMGLGIAMVLVFLLAVGQLPTGKRRLRNSRAQPAHGRTKIRQRTDTTQLLRWTQRHLR